MSDVEHVKEEVLEGGGRMLSRDQYPSRATSMDLNVVVDEGGRVHAFTDDRSTWKFLTPIEVSDLIDAYSDLVDASTEGLMNLNVVVDEGGRVHAFTDDRSTWKFLTPIEVSDLIDAYKGILDNVVVEAKATITEATTSEDVSSTSMGVHDRGGRLLRFRNRNGAEVYQAKSTESLKQTL